MPESQLILIHLAWTLVMVGIIWFVQVVHYPLMNEVGQENFVRYSDQHQKRTSWVVIGPMALEALSGAYWAMMCPSRWSSPTFVLAFVLLLIVWLSTAFLQVPIHQELLRGHDRDKVDRLVRTNWIRTIGWTLRAGIVAWMYAETVR